MPTGTKVLQCNCVNEQQDKIRGKGARVHNLTASQTTTYRCTVCSNEKIMNAAVKKPSK